MATINATPCKSCDDLKKIAPDFVQNGVTDEVCASLSNDKGLNSSNKNRTDCDDLKLANDCLIGGLYDDIERYDECDWKCFARKLVSNTFALFGAVICAICGLWVNIHELWAEIAKLKALIDALTKRVDALEKAVDAIQKVIDKLQKLIDNLESELDKLWKAINRNSSRIDTMCELINAQTAPPVRSYGVLNLADTAERRIGQIAKKNGSPVAIPYPDDGSLNPYTKGAQNIGIYYGNIEYQSCSTDECTVVEWIAPHTFLYWLVPELEDGDVIWYVSKSELQSKCEFSDFLWRTFTESSFTWKATPTYGGGVDHSHVWLKLTCNPGGMGENYFGMEFKGFDYPNPTPSGNYGIDNMDSPWRPYRHACGQS